MSLLYLLAGELTSTGLRLLEDAWYPYARWWREPVLSLFLWGQVTDCCSSPSGARAATTHTHLCYVDEPRGAESTTAHSNHRQYPFGGLEATSVTMKPLTIITTLLDGLQTALGLEPYTVLSSP